MHKETIPMFNALEEPFPMVETRDGRLVTAAKDYSRAKKISAFLNEILNSVVTSDRERTSHALEALIENVPVDCDEWLDPLRDFSARLKS